MDNITSFLVSIVPSLFVGLLMWRFQRAQSRRDEREKEERAQRQREQDQRDERRFKRDTLLLNLTVAQCNAFLGLFTALKNNHVNGELAAVQAEFEPCFREYEKFIKEQAVESLRRGRTA